METTLLERFGRRLRVGMIGGGLGSFIGQTHRIALRADGLWELTAGAFSRNPQTSRATGRGQLIARDRIYSDYRELIRGEASREDRVDAVIVATRPSDHAAITLELLAAGFDVICEKPLTATTDEARRVAEAVAATGRRLLLTHCYTGYPMVRAAREMIRRGDLGAITMVEAEFAGGAYAGATPAAAWRVGTEEAGEAGLLLDLGTHALNLAEFTTGTRITTVGARLHRLDPDHGAYDNAFLDLTFDDGAVGRCWSTSQAAGASHGLRISVYGDRGALTWEHERAEVMAWRRVDAPELLLTKAGPGATAEELSASRFTAGHPDGYALAFANLYRDFGYALLAERLGEDPSGHLERVPGAEDGLHTLAVIDAALLSHRERAAAAVAVTPAMDVPMR